MFLTKIYHFFLEKMSSQNRRKSCFRASSRHNFLRRPFMVAEMGLRQSGKYVTDFFFFLKLATMFMKKCCTAYSHSHALQRWVRLMQSV